MMSKRAEKNAVRPLKSKTMTLNELQLRTLDVLRKTKFQLRRNEYEEGMSDEEFIEAVIEELETDIYQDRQVLKMARSQRKQPAEGHGKE